MENNQPNPLDNQNIPPAAPQPRPGYTYVPPPRYTFPMGKPELMLALLVMFFSLVMFNGLLFAGANLAFAVGILGNLFSTAGYLWIHKNGPTATPPDYSCSALLSPPHLSVLRMRI